MKKLRHLSLLALALCPSSLAVAADLGVEGTTILRLEQRAVPNFDKQRVVPLTQFIGADVGHLADGNLSLHLYGWGRVDIADRSTDEGRTDGDFSYGYLSYHFPTANAEVKAGRFFISEGVAAEQVDGVSARTDLPGGFAVSLFTGAPVRLDRGDHSKGEFIAGGRGSYRFGHMLEVGVSGLDETGGTFNPTTRVKRDRQLVGGDFWFSPERLFELSGHTFYNTETDGVAEHSYLATVRPLRTVAVSALYNETRFANFFTSTNLPTLFDPANDGHARSYGGTVTYTGFAPLEGSIDYRRFNRTDSLTATYNGNSHRYGGNLRLTFLDKKLRSGVEYHRVNGASSFSSYHEARGFLFYDAGRYLASLDAIGQFYDKTFANTVSTSESYEVIASAGMRLMPALSLSGDVSYGKTALLTEELRGLLRLTFNYQAESKGAKK